MFFLITDHGERKFANPSRLSSNLKEIFKTDLSHPLSFVFVFSLLSGSRLVLICPLRCFPVLIFNFTCTCRYQMLTQFYIGGSLVSLKFLFGFLNQCFSFSLVCSFFSITIMQVQLQVQAKTLCRVPRGSVLGPLFYFYCTLMTFIIHQRTLAFC